MAFKLYVGGLPYSATEDELRDLFAQYGTVLSVAIINDRDTGRSKGFGFVELESAEEGNAAIKALHDTDFGGRNITVNEARPKEDRPRNRF